LRMFACKFFFRQKWVFANGRIRAVAIWTNVYKSKAVVGVRNSQQNNLKVVLEVIKQGTTARSITPTCLLSLGPTQSGKFARFLKPSSIVFHSCSVGGAIHTGTRIRHSAWQTCRTILAAVVIQILYEKCNSENMQPVAKNL
jgi:hypothetical protein